MRNLNNISLEGPFFIVEAPKETQIDYFTPKPGNTEDLINDTSDCPYKIMFESEDKEIKVYLVSEKNQELS